jgi:hypothetical protein
MAMAARDEVLVPAMTDELMYEHRADWATMVLGDDAIDLADVADPIAALKDAEAAMWLDGYVPAARDALVSAAGQGVRLVVAVPANVADAEDLARDLPGAVVVPQVPTGGSLIGTAATALVKIDEPASREHAAWLLVTANVDSAETHARIGVAISARLASHFSRLDDALHALQEANVRLARARLGRHDAAAGAAIHRLAEREARWRERFEFEQQLAARHHEWFMEARERLNQPQYRAADRVYHGRLRRLPGLRPLVRWLGRQ